jgi:hypothetical protein
MPHAPQRRFRYAFSQKELHSRRVQHMNGTLCKTESLVDDLFSHTTSTPAPQDCFATAPMQAIWREPDCQREEEVYTSFEAAISNRVLALKERHISTYVETGAHRRILPAMDLANKAFTLWHNICSKRIWKRGALLFGAALMFMLLGFDLMGLLVLHAR